MAERILVAYATNKGSTAEVAASIAKMLRTRDFEVDVRSVTVDPSVEGYDAAIIGSAVNGGQWLPEAVAFARQHLVVLGRMPVAVFSVHIMNAGADERSRRKRLAYLDAVRRFLRPVDEAFFLGIGPDPTTDSWLSRWLFRRFGGAGEGDCRDWDAIRAWAGDVFGKQFGRSRARIARPDRNRRRSVDGDRDEQEFRECVALNAQQFTRESLLITPSVARVTVATGPTRA